MRKYKNNQLEIWLAENDDTVIMEWIGHSRTLDPALELDPYLAGLSAELMNRKIIIDFRKLISMNSSTIMPIIFFIRKLEEKAIPTTIIYNGNSSWQRASFVVIEEIIKAYKYVKFETNSAV